MGHHAILQPAEVLGSGVVDGVCVGEGELPLLQAVASYLEHGREGMRAEGVLFRTSPGQSERPAIPWLMRDLGEYPYFDYALFDAEGTGGLRGKKLNTLSGHGVFSIPMMVGRGCPYTCSYCCKRLCCRSSRWPAGLCPHFGIGTRGGVHRHCSAPVQTAPTRLHRRGLRPFKAVVQGVLPHLPRPGRVANSWLR